MSQQRTSAFQLLDWMSFLFLFFLLVLMVLHADRIDEWAGALRGILGAAGLLFVSSVIGRKDLPGSVQAAARVVGVLGAFGLLFPVAEKLQHVFIQGWLDDQVVQFEMALWGGELSVLMQPLVHPLLTEWMMFAYVIYVPLLPLTGWLCYHAGHMRAVNDYTLSLALSYSVCYLGFMLFPLATQMHHAPHLYSVPLEGWLFTALGEWMRGDVHAPGAALPSPHCAAGTVILLMTRKYARGVFPLMLIIIVTLYVSTVYGRYHYVWDSIAGVLVGILCVWAAPRLVGMVDRLREYRLLASGK